MKLLLLALLATALVAAGCGGGSTETVTVEKTVEVEAEDPGSADPVLEPDDAAGDRAESGGIEVTLKDAYSRETVQIQGGTITSSNPKGVAKTVKAPQGGRYIYVDTEVSNGTAAGLDLTCSAPMEVNLLDSSDREFDPIEELAEIKGNPGCNVLLQPGFSDRMLWIFLVPPDANVTGLRFAAYDPVTFEPQRAAVIEVPGDL